jgi:hypothetical protein
MGSDFLNDSYFTKCALGELNLPLESLVNISEYANKVFGVEN